MGQIVTGQLLPGLLVIERELLLFAAFWFIVSALDELAIDLSWLWLKLAGRAREHRVAFEEEGRALLGKAAIFVPAWKEADVIDAMIAHTLASWPQHDLTLYVGCYCNDPATIASAMAGAKGDPRVRLVIHERAGPTTKADCLNRIYEAMCMEEERGAFRFRSIILHDAEDMVHPAALSVIDRALEAVQFVQLPVRPEPQATSRWVAGHYSDEFAEAHAKSMVVRNALGAAIPAAGVGCGFGREFMDRLAHQHARSGTEGPFASDCLTEDYELGLLASGSGTGGRFLRLRDHLGEVIATRAFFPGRIDYAVRQKARWVHGIALQGWDRIGWRGGILDCWMAMRDRRGPLTAIVLAAGYALVAVEAILGMARMAGTLEPVALSPVLAGMIALSFAAFVWRALWRFCFTAGEYGLAEGILAVLRIPVANVIAIMAGRRAVAAYVRTLRGSSPSWDKTDHAIHPARSLKEVVTG